MLNLIRTKLVFVLAVLFFPVFLFVGSNTYASTTSFIISPTSPDGSNGYYKTQPTFRLISTRVGDGAVVYKIGNDIWTTYSSSCGNVSTFPIDPYKPFPIGAYTFFYGEASCNSKPNPVGTIYSENIKYDPDSPTINFNSPKDNATVSKQTVTITGNVSDPTSPINTLTINGVGVGFVTNGNFSKQITLSKGLNRIVGVVYDKAGNSISEELFVTYKPSATNNSQESSTPEETVVSDLVGIVLGSESEEKTSKTSNIPTEESTASSTKSASQVKEENPSDSEVQGSFFRNNIILTLFILIILSGVGVLAFKTKAVNRFIKNKLHKKGKTD